MATAFANSIAKSAFVGRPVVSQPRASASRARFQVQAAARPLWAPGVEAPGYLDGSLAGDYGWDPLGLGANPEALKWYRQAELQNGRWAMLGVAGILAQELYKPDVFWYTAGMPQNVPDLYFGNNGLNLGGLLAWEFLLMHWVEVRRWQDIKKFGSVNQDPVFSSNSLSNPEMGYPGFDPLNFFAGDKESLKTKEIKNARLAMVAFVGFTIQAQATGKNPLACLFSHISNPFADNIGANIGRCMIPSSVDVQGITIPLTCLWPGTFQ